MVVMVMVVMGVMVVVVEMGVMVVVMEMGVMGVMVVEMENLASATTCTGSPSRAGS